MLQRCCGGNLASKGGPKSGGAPRPEGRGCRDRESPVAKLSLAHDFSHPSSVILVRGAFQEALCFLIHDQPYVIKRGFP